MSEEPPPKLAPEYGGHGDAESLAQFHPRKCKVAVLNCRRAQNDGCRNRGIPSAGLLDLFLATTEQLEAVSKACGVPRAWFELDWQAAGSSETALTVMATRLRDIEEALRVIEAAVSPGRRTTKSK